MGRTLIRHGKNYKNNDLTILEIILLISEVQYNSVRVLFVKFVIVHIGFLPNSVWKLIVTLKNHATPPYKP